MSSDKVLEDLSITIKHTAKDCETYKKRCNEVEYDFDPVRMRSEQVITVKTTTKIPDIVDELKQLKLELEKIKAGDIDEQDPFSRAEFSTGSYGLRTSGIAIWTGSIGHNFYLDHPENGLLGTGHVAANGSQLWISDTMYNGSVLYYSGGMA